MFPPPETLHRQAEASPGRFSLIDDLQHVDGGHITVVVDVVVPFPGGMSERRIVVWELM